MKSWILGWVLLSLPCTFPAIVLGDTSSGSTVIDDDDLSLGQAVRPYGVVLVDNLRILSFDGVSHRKLIREPLAAQGREVGSYLLYKMEIGKHTLSCQFIQNTAAKEGAGLKITTDYSTRAQSKEIQIESGRYYVLTGMKSADAFQIDIRESGRPVVYRRQGGYELALQEHPSPEDFDYVRGQRLLEAVRQGNVDRVRTELANQKGIMKIRWNKYDYSLLHVAMEATSNRLELVEYLIREGMSPNERTGGKHDPDFLPIHAAAMRKVDNQSPGVVQALVKHKAAVNAKTESQETPLSLVCNNSSGMVPSDAEAALATSVARILIENGAEVNVSDRNGFTPLTAAVWANNQSLIKLLLDNGAKCNIQDVNGNSPLHEAAKRGRADAARMLLSHQASINVRNKEGCTPLHLAAKAATDATKQEKVEALKNTVEVLLSSGASVNEKDNEGRTALFYAYGGPVFEAIRSRGGAK